jgi:pyruvate formate lyase activating enzyme
VPSTGRVFDIRKFCLHDGPGIRTTVFLKGCPLSCLWCHNPEGLDFGYDLVFRPERCIGCGECERACPLPGPCPYETAGKRGQTPGQGRGALDGAASAGSGLDCREGGDFPCSAACPADARNPVGRECGVEELLATIDADREYYDGSGGGATFSGGEPLAQSDFLAEALAACRSARIHTAVDTSGYALEATLLKIAELADLFLFDLKLMDTERHEKATGVPNGRILENLAALSNAGASVVVRIPVVPGMNDLPGDLEAAADFIAALGAGYPVDLLPFHGAARGKYELRGEEFRCSGILSPTKERMRELAGIFASRRLMTKVGGEEP